MVKCSTREIYFGKIYLIIKMAIIILGYYHKFKMYSMLTLNSYGYVANNQIT